MAWLQIKYCLSNVVNSGLVIELMQRKHIHVCVIYETQVSPAQHPVNHADQGGGEEEEREAALQLQRAHHDGHQTGMAVTKCDQL